MEYPDDKPQIDSNPDQESDTNLDKIGKSIKQLKYGELSAQVDALVILNEIITSSLEEHWESLTKNANFLIETISKVLFETFDKPTEQIPLKFGKYFITIIGKVCAIEFLIKVVEEWKIQTFVE